MEFPESLRKYLDRHVSRPSDCFGVGEDHLECQRSNWLTPWRWNRRWQLAIGVLSLASYIASWPVVEATLHELGYPEPASTIMVYVFLPLVILRTWILFGFF